RVFELKGRPADHPLIVHVGSIEQARDCAADWPDAADQLAQSFWPGPLTLVLPKSETIDAAITAGQDTVALRMPDHPLALTVLRAAGVPFVAPSANLFTQLSPTRAEDVASAFSSDDVRVVDGGPCQVGIESTILALDAEQRVARVLRPGMVTPAELQSALPIDWSIDQRDETSTRAPGQMAVHYRPAQALRVEVLADASALEDRLQSLQSSGAAVLTLPDSASEAARLLYRLLREPEAATSDELILLLRQAQIDDPAWQGIVNRLTKAASRWIGASS
ncbi:MAG: L-threonylcarbamoyladenylate synthase, partial [Pseudomonadota bacterium]